jgi:hypothetical protein
MEYLLRKLHAETCESGSVCSARPGISWAGEVFGHDGELWQNGQPCDDDDDIEEELRDNGEP